MNSRKAKALRRVARRMSRGLPERNLVSSTSRTVKVWTGHRDSLGQPIMRPAPVGGTLRHKPTTFRAVYRKLKAVYGHAKLGELR